MHRAPRNKDQRAGTGDLADIASEELGLSLKHVEHFICIHMDVRRGP